MIIVGAMWFFELKQYWFVFLVVIAALVLLISGRKPKETGSEMYSPDLMRLLGGEV